MTSPSITDWMSGIGTVVASVAAIVAGIAAIVAARFTKLAVAEAAKAAKAAADQVELQRPKPVVVASFRRSFSANQQLPSDTAFQLVNIGDSPAFDVEVSPLKIPSLEGYLIHASCLSTERLSYLQPEKPPLPAAHHLDPPQGVLAALGTAAAFTGQLSEFFNEKCKHEALPGAYRHQIGFTLSYRALDGRRFEHAYIFVVSFSQQRAWIEPVQSLLEASMQEVRA